MQVVYDFMTIDKRVHHRSNHLSEYCQCTPAKVACANGTCVQYKPEIQPIQVYPWHNTRVSRAQPSTLRRPCVSKYATLLGLERSFRQPPHKIRSSSSIIPSSNWSSALLYDSYVYCTINIFAESKKKKVLGHQVRLLRCPHAHSVRFMSAAVTQEYSHPVDDARAFSS
jgi:hypothetical protein